jgi:hypothetical protein
MYSYSELPQMDYNTDSDKQTIATEERNTTPAQFQED